MFWDALDWVGRIATVVVIVGFVEVGILWARGALPVLTRIGLGLARRKVAIFARADDQDSLQQLLIDSGLFSESNIIAVRSTADLGRAEAATVYLLYWPDWTEDFDKVLALKRDAVPLVVYAPNGRGRIEPDQMIRLNEHRNVLVSNFRGRLLNDLVTSLITTSHEQR